MKLNNFESFFGKTINLLKEFKLKESLYYKHDNYISIFFRLGRFNGKGEAFFFFTKIIFRMKKKITYYKPPKNVKSIWKVTKQPGTW